MIDMRLFAWTALALCGAVATPALAEEMQFVSAWNTAVQITAERSDRRPTADVASPTWGTSNWVTEPAPAQYGAGAVLIRNRWRQNSYLTYVHELRPEREGSATITNLQLKPRLTAPGNRQDAVLADGQAWMLEPAGPGNAFIRIRTAHRGFGLSYVRIPSTGIAANELYVGGLTAISGSGNDVPEAAALWVKGRANQGDVTQCVRNVSGMAFNVDWYYVRDARFMAPGKDAIILPPENKKPILTEAKSLGFSSCETSPERMLAVVRLIGKKEVESLANFAVGVPAFLAGAAAGLGGGPAGQVALGLIATTAIYKPLGDFLRKAPETVYVGVPSPKITMRGAIGNMYPTAD